MPRRDLSALDAVLDQTADAVVATDREYRICGWNRAAARIYGWSYDDVIGRPTTEVLRTVWETDEDRRQSIEELREEGTWSGEVVQLRRDGEPIRVAVTVRVVADNEGGVERVVAVARDLTDEWEAARALDLARGHMLYARELEGLAALAAVTASRAGEHAGIIRSAVATAAATLPANHPATQALVAAARAADLLDGAVQSLSARSSRQLPGHDVLDLAQVLAELEPLLRIGARVEVISNTERCWVRAERVRIEHVLTSLVSPREHQVLRLESDLEHVRLAVEPGTAVDWDVVAALVSTIGGTVSANVVQLPRVAQPFVAESCREPLRVAVLSESGPVRDAAVQLARALGHDVVDAPDADVALRCGDHPPSPRTDLPVVDLLDDNEGLKAPDRLAEALDAARFRLN